MNFIEINQNTILKAILVFIRIACLLNFLPVFGDKNVPVRVRIILAIALSIGLYSLVPNSWFPLASLNLNQIVFVVLIEVLIGFSFGFMAKMLFEGFIMAANIVGYQMGFGTANLLIPGSDYQVSSFTALHRNLVIILFLVLSLHYIFIEGLVRTFEILPAGSALFTENVISVLISQSADIFYTAMKLSAPILVSLLFAMVIMGVFARTVPQIQIFTMSFPVSFFIGMAIYVSTIFLFPSWIRDYFKEKTYNLFSLINLLRQ